MLLILTGQDDYSLNEALKKIKGEVADAESLPANMTVLEGQRVSIDQLRPVCEAAPFLAEKRLVIIEGLLGRYEPKRGSRRPAGGGPSGRRKTAEKKDDPKPLADYFSTVPPSTVVVLVDAEIKQTNPMLKALAGKGKQETFPLLREAQLKEWIRARAQHEKATIAPAAVDLLAKAVGSNLWVMSSELTKLTIYADGRQIEADDVRLLTGYSQQQNIFALVDSIVEGRTQNAGRQLEKTLQSGASASYVMAMLARQMRMIVTAQEMKAQRTPIAEARGRLGLSAEFAARKVLEQAGRYSLPRLRQVYGLLVEADLALQTGRYEPELAVSLLRTYWGRRGLALPATGLAKLKTLVQGFAVVFAVLPPTASDATWVATGLLWAAVVLTVVTGVQYFVVGRRAVTEAGQK